MFYFFNASLIHKKCYVDFSDILFLWMLTVGNLTISFARSHIVYTYIYIYYYYYFINEERKKSWNFIHTRIFIYDLGIFYNVTKNVFWRVDKKWMKKRSRLLFIPKMEKAPTHNFDNNLHFYNVYSTLIGLYGNDFFLFHF